MSNFKFQSDSINTETAAESEAPAEVFKFQSDSINTKMSTEEWLDERL